MRTYGSANDTMNPTDDIISRDTLLAILADAEQRNDPYLRYEARRALTGSRASALACAMTLPGDGFTSSELDRICGPLPEGMR